MTHVSEVTDLMIEHFDFEIHGPEGVLYDGSTYFGFFIRTALERQEGIRDTQEKAFRPAGDQLAKTAEFVFTDEAPVTPNDPGRSGHRGLAFPSKALRMIDQIELYLPRGGPLELGFVRGSKQIDPDEWFFHAHFFQDPVWPGSLGLESFLQLLKFAAVRRWPQLVSSHRFALATGQSHRWSYRGQVVPRNRKVTVEALVTRESNEPHPALYGEGYLMVDDLCIYRMENLGIQLLPLT
jgi:3-hydroxymyristoyl/3-hydroxydecanoyl-(acyl carrier protein) dehydratase